MDLSPPPAAGSADLLAGLPAGRRWLLGVLLLALAIGPFVRSLEGGFVFDDRRAVVDNPLVTGPADPAGLLTSGFWGDPRGAVSGSFRPLTTVTFLLDWRVGGGDPWFFHLTNLLLHGATVLLLFLVLWRRLARLDLALLTSALVAVHALHTENVAGIVGRADVLATCFGLAAWGVAGSGSRRGAWLVGPLLLLALLAKETAIGFVGLLLGEALLQRSPRPTPTRRVWLGALVGCGFAVLVYLALRLHALGGLGATVGLQSNPLVDAGGLSRLWTAAALLSRTLGLLLVPLELSADYSFPEILPWTSPGSVEVLAGLVAWALLPAALLYWRRRRPARALGLLLLLAGYLPVANLVVLIPTVFAERLLYLPSLGFALLCADLLRGALGPRSGPDARRGRQLLGVGLVLLLLGGHAVRAAVRTGDWQSNRTLFTSAVVVTPRSARAWFGLAEEERLVGDLDRAAAAYARVVELAPTWAAAHSYLGTLLHQQGLLAPAAHHLRQAYLLAPDCRDCAANFARFLLLTGDPAAAAAPLAALRRQGGPPAQLQELEELARRVAAPGLPSPAPGLPSPAPGLPSPAPGIPSPALGIPSPAGLFAPAVPVGPDRR